MKPYPPLGILYISAYLKKYGWDNEVFDSTFSTEEQLKKKLISDSPEILALYTNLVTKESVIRLIQFVKTQHELSRTTIILGGPDVTHNIDDYLKASADILVVGEGEQTMLELVQHFSVNGADLKDISGIAFLYNGTVIRTPPRKKIKDLDELPMPDRAAINLKKYIDVWKKRHGYSAISVSTQRGCPYTCKWCSTAVYGQSYRRRSPKNVVAELKLIHREYAPDTVWFVDDVFTVSHNWLAEFSREMVSEKLNMKFECITRAERLNDTVLAQLKDAGCFRIWIGAESGSQQILNAMDRRVEVTVVRDMIRRTKKFNIETGTFIMIGYPGETEKDINETIHHLKISDPEHFTITLSYPIKGTDLYDQVETDILDFPDWQTSTDRDLDFKRTYNRKFYHHAIRRVTNEVNYNKQLLAGKRLSPEALNYMIRSIFAYFGMKWERTKG